MDGQPIIVAGKTEGIAPFEQAKCLVVEFQVWSQGDDKGGSLSVPLASKNQLEYDLSNLR